MNGMRSGSGEAAKIVKQTAKVADGYIASANNAYDRALQTHNQLKEEAPGVLAEIKSTLEAQRIEAERKAAEEAFAATRKKEEIMQELAETPADTAQYEYIKELPPGQRNIAIQDANEEIMQRRNTWLTETKSGYAALVNSYFGQTPSIDNYGTNSSVYLNPEQADAIVSKPERIQTALPYDYGDYDYYGLYLMNYMSGEDMHHYMNETEVKKLKRLANEYKEYYDDLGIKSSAFFNERDVFMQQRLDAYQDILADYEGLNNKQVTVIVSTDEIFIKTLSDSIVCYYPYYMADGVYFNAAGVENTVEAKQAETDQRYNDLITAYEEYKEKLQSIVDSYNRTLTDLYLAWGACADIRKEMQNLANNELPDYVYTQNVLYNADYTVGDDLPYLSIDNTALKNKIEAAANLSGGKEAFFSREAAKLEKLYNKFTDLNSRYDTIYSVYVKNYLKNIEDSELSLSCRELEDINYFEERGIENTSSFVPYAELERQCTIKHEEDIAYNDTLDYQYIPDYTESQFNKYCLSKQDMTKISVAKALAADFRGNSVKHAELAERLALVKGHFGEICRNINQGGRSAYYEMRDEYISMLEGTYNTVKNYSTYSGPYAKMGKNSGKTFYDEFYGPKGIITKFNQMFSDTKVSHIPVEDISINGSSSVTVEEGKSTTLSVTVSPDNATDKNVVWYSSDPRTVIVDTNGVITGISAGSAVVSARPEDCPLISETVDGETVYYYDPSYAASFNVTVTGVPMDDIAAANSAYSLKNYGSTAVPVYYMVLNGGNSLKMEYIPPENSTDTVTLEAYNENGDLIASDTYNNILYNEGVDEDICRLFISENEPIYSAKAYVTTEDGTRYELFNGTENVSEELLGDVNGDGVVNSDDAALLLKYLSGTAQLNDTQKANANVNTADLDLNLLDVIAILNAVPSNNNS